MPNNANSVTSVTHFWFGWSALKFRSRRFGGLPCRTGRWWKVEHTQRSISTERNLSPVRFREMRCWFRWNISISTTSAVSFWENWWFVSLVRSGNKTCRCDRQYWWCQYKQQNRFFYYNFVEMIQLSWFFKQGLATQRANTFIIGWQTIALTITMQEMD